MWQIWSAGVFKCFSNVIVDRATHTFPCWIVLVVASIGHKPPPSPGRSFFKHGWSRMESVVFIRRKYALGTRHSWYPEKEDVQCRWRSDSRATGREQEIYIVQSRVGSRKLEVSGSNPKQVARSYNTVFLFQKRKEDCFLYLSVGERNR